MRKVQGAQQDFLLECFMCSPMSNHTLGLLMLISCAGWSNLLTHQSASASQHSFTGSNFYQCTIPWMQAKQSIMNKSRVWTTRLFTRMQVYEIIQAPNLPTVEFGIYKLKIHNFTSALIFFFPAKMQTPSITDNNFDLDPVDASLWKSQVFEIIQTPS